MIWLTGSIRTWWLLAAGAMGGIASALLVGVTFAVPALDQSLTFQQLPMTVIIPLVFVVVGGGITAQGATASAAVSARRHAMLINSSLFAAIITFVMFHIIGLMLTAGLDDLAGARNALAYAALLYTAQNFVGVGYAPLIPAIYAVIATIFGRVGGVIQLWAWPALPASWSDLAVACLAALATAVTASAWADRSSGRFYGITRPAWLNSQ